MKRYIAIVLAVLMAAATVGCGQSGNLFPESTGSGGAVQTEPVDEAGMKVGYLLPSGVDATDTISRMDGIRQMQFETGLKDSQIFIRTDVTKKDSAAVLEELVQEGCNIIFACDKAYENAVIEAAGQHPDVTFCQEDGKKAKKSGLANMHNYYVRLFEAYYAAGVISGMKINELLNSGRISAGDCVVGFAAYEESPEVISCANAFALGVDQVCSQASMLVRYTDTAGNFDEDAACARQLLEAGASFMVQFVNTTGVATVCAENDIPIIGNAVNIIDVAPSEALTSAVTDWSVYYTYAVNCLLQGQAVDVDWCGGYEDGSVILSQLNDAHIAEGTVDRLKEVEADLRDGKAEVFNTENFTVDGDSLETLAEENDDFKKFAKNIKDGEYLESNKRSAPSMDFFIDGIEVSTYDYLAGENAEETDADVADDYDADDAYDEDTYAEEDADADGDAADDDSAADEETADADRDAADDEDADTAGDEDETTDEDADTTDDEGEASDEDADAEENEVQHRQGSGGYDFSRDEE